MENGINPYGHSDIITINFKLEKYFLLLSYAGLYYCRTGNFWNFAGV